ncbi:MAG TPA: HEAT repeat domain-containing protein [Gaiellaceae bacterium]|nr:HEAT repeat domain-containing protein [Gaiellaceae bacterium]
MSLAEAGVQANALAESGNERDLAKLRAAWADELEAQARSENHLERAAAYRAVGQFRFRQKEELLRRGLEDVSPACRGSALLSLELLSREHPRSVNSVRPLLHNLANADDNEAVRRLAILSLRNGSAQRDTIVLLQGIAEEEGISQETRQTAAKVAAGLDKRAKTR